MRGANNYLTFANPDRNQDLSACGVNQADHVNWRSCRLVANVTFALVVVLSCQNLQGALFRFSWRVDRGRYQDELGRDLCTRLPKIPVPGTVISVDATLPLPVGATLFRTGHTSDVHIDEVNASLLEGLDAAMFVSLEPQLVGIGLFGVSGTLVGNLVGPTFDPHRRPPISQWQSSIFGGYVANLDGLSDCSFDGEAISADYHVGGDSNLDGVFDSSDFVTVFQSGQYDDAIALNSTWETGDWDGDREFDSGDLVYAFAEGSYQGAATSIISVPEPGTVALATSTCFYVCVRVARHRRQSSAILECAKHLAP